jgi:hypothetical protein
LLFVAGAGRRRCTVRLFVAVSAMLLLARAVCLLRNGLPLLKCSFVVTVCHCQSYCRSPLFTETAVVIAVVEILALSCLVCLLVVVVVENV